MISHKKHEKLQKNIRSYYVNKSFKSVVDFFVLFVFFVANKNGVKF